MQFCSDEFSSSCSSQNPGWASGFLQTWATRVHALHILHHAWITCLTWSFFRRNADIPANLNLQWGCSPFQVGQQRSLHFHSCSLYVSFSRTCFITELLFPVSYGDDVLECGLTLLEFFKNIPEEYVFRVDIVQKQYCLLHNISSILGECQIEEDAECSPIQTRAGYEYIL